MAAVTSLQPLSMAKTCCCCLPAAAPKPCLSILSFPSSKSLCLRVHLSFSHSPLPFLSLRRKKLHLSSLVSQTSGWAFQEEEIHVEDEDFDWPAVEEEDQQLGAEAGLSESEEEQLPTEEGAGEGENVAGVDGGFVEGEGLYYPEPPEEAKLFVGNIPYDMDSENLAQLFDKAGVVEVAEVIYNRETDQSRGFGFVTMSNVEEAEKAVETFHRYEVNGRLLTVNKAAPRGARVERNQRTFEPSFRIYVGNLPWQVDDARLEQVFSEHGKVLDARVVYDRESGRSRGFGFVRMASHPEMDDAIAALDGQSLDGRAIRVDVAEERPQRASF